jgi:hypothetical protein
MNPEIVYSDASSLPIPDEKPKFPVVSDAYQQWSGSGAGQTFRQELCTGKDAVYSREYRLRHDLIEVEQKRRDRKKAKTILGRFEKKAKCFKRAYVTRVKHHLSKGRSVVDIVIRERIPASVVQQIVDSL